MVTPVTSTPAASAASPPVDTSTAAGAQKSLSTNFDTFLTLLTTQLQNQDPLSPMDSSQFTQQLVQFSQVEQQIDANKNLESLISLTQSRNNLDAVSYLGKTITTTDGTGALANGQANWTYSLNNDASTNMLMVSDANGKLVYVTPGETAAGAHTFTWNGKDAAGNQLPDGGYTLSVHANLSSGDAVGSSLKSQGAVTEVDLSGSEPLLMVGSMSVPISKVSLISGM